MTQHKQTIADRSYLQGQLKENMDLLRAVVKETTDAIYVKDLDGRYLLFNEAAEQISGMRAEEVLGRDDNSVFPPDYARTVIDEDHTVMTLGAAMTFEEALITSTGEERNYLTTKGPLFDNTGIMTGTFGISRDITERKRMELELHTLNAELEQRVAERTAALVTANEQLRRETEEHQQALAVLNEREQQLQLYLDRMPIGHIVWDLDFRVVAWNPAAEKIFGFAAAEALGKIPYEFIVSEKVRSDIAPVMERLFSGDNTAHSINENLTKDGRTIICEWHNTPILDPQGRMIAVMSMVQDITERNGPRRRCGRVRPNYILPSNRQGQASGTGI